MPHLAFFLASFAWNYGLGMTYVVMPLYARSQGLSGVEIGLLFSMPVFAQVVFNLLGGFGWGLSHLSTPLAMGWFADRFDMATGFYVPGSFAVFWTMLIGMLRPWAFARPSTGRPA